MELSLITECLQNLGQNNHHYQRLRKAENLLLSVRSPEITLFRCIFSRWFHLFGNKLDDSTSWYSRSRHYCEVSGCMNWNGLLWTNNDAQSFSVSVRQCCDKFVSISTANLFSLQKIKCISFGNATVSALKCKAHRTIHVIGSAVLYAVCWSAPH